MDPLSVTASVVGLLEATAKVASLVRTVKGASSLMQDVLSEIADIRMSLGQLQTLLFGAEAKFRSRASLLMVEDIIVVLTKAVMTFSKLEKIFEQFEKDESLRVVSRMKLALKEPTVSKLLVRLQSSRASLSLMVTTFTCTSLEAAQASERQLNALVQQVLKCNQDMSSRLANMEMQGVGSARPSKSQDIEETEDDSATIKPQSLVSNISRKRRAESTHDLIKGFGFSFDRDLSASRVYTRVSRRTSNSSCSSSVVPSMGWSFQSGLSLADISNISTLSLPISPNELWNAQHYSLHTGDDILEVQQIKSDKLKRVVTRNPIFAPGLRGFATILHSGVSGTVDNRYRGAGQLDMQRRPLHTGSVGARSDRGSV